MEAQGRSHLLPNAQKKIKNNLEHILAFLT